MSRRVVFPRETMKRLSGNENDARLFRWNIQAIRTRWNDSPAEGNSSR